MVPDLYVGTDIISAVLCTNSISQALYITVYTVYCTSPFILCTPPKFCCTSEYLLYNTFSVEDPISCFTVHHIPAVHNHAVDYLPFFSTKIYAHKYILSCFWLYLSCILYNFILLYTIFFNVDLPFLLAMDQTCCTVLLWCTFLLYKAFPTLNLSSCTFPFCCTTFRLYRIVLLNTTYTFVQSLIGCTSPFQLYTTLPTLYILHFLCSWHLFAIIFLHHISIVDWCKQLSIFHILTWNE